MKFRWIHGLKKRGKGFYRDCEIKKKTKMNRSIQYKDVMLINEGYQSLPSLILCEEMECSFKQEETNWNTDETLATNEVLWITWIYWEQIAWWARVEEKEKKAIEFNIKVNSKEDKGWRHTMEDAWFVLLDYSSNSPVNLRFPTSFCEFGLGWLCAFVSQSLHPSLVNEPFW